MANILGGVKFQHFWPPLRPKNCFSQLKKWGRPKIDDNFGWCNTRTSSRGRPKEKPKICSGQNRTSLKLPSFPQPPSTQPSQQTLNRSRQARNHNTRTQQNHAQCAPNKVQHISDVYVCICTCAKMCFLCSVLKFTLRIVFLGCQHPSTTQKSMHNMG